MNAAAALATSPDMWGENVNYAVKSPGGFGQIERANQRGTEV
jgi:hypothetical protein